MTGTAGTMTDKKTVMRHGMGIPVDRYGDMDIPLYSFILFFCHI
jgi:hypothetical protein